MKYIIQFILLLFVLDSHSQEKAKTDPVKKIVNSSTVLFTADNSGCFGGETITYKLVKQKNGDRKVSYKKAGKDESRKIKAKDYSAFVKNYSLSYDKFRDPDAVKQTCTSVSVFSLSGGKDSLGFKNVTCQGEFNPEFYLLEKLK
jgi:hypothetical protein